MTPVLSFVVLASALALPPPFFATPPGLSAPAQCSSASAAAKGPSALNGVIVKSMCTADCGPLNNPSSVSASGSICTCVDQDKACPGGPGYATCDGISHFCPACCTNGAKRDVTVGPICGCPDGQSTLKDHYLCVNGVWEYQYSFCTAPFCSLP